LPDDEKVYRWMKKAETRAVVDFFMDCLAEAEGELRRVESEAEAEIQELKQRMKTLQARFLRDSHNSSQPPSSDGLRKARVSRTQSLRAPSPQPSGGQPGHDPRYREQEAAHEIRLYRLDRCARCQRPLREVVLVQHEVRQVIDLNQGKKWVIEHRAEMKLCPECGSMNHAGFPREASAYVAFGPEVKRIALYLRGYQLLPVFRIVEFFEDLFDLKLSEGVLHSWAIQASRGLKRWENQTQVALTQAARIHLDETGIRSEGRLQWLHTTSSETHTLYGLHAKRGSQAIEEIGILPHFSGIAIHDGYSPYWKYRENGITHGLCNAHHLRELTYVHELETLPLRSSSGSAPSPTAHWALGMKTLLQETLHEQHLCLAQGQDPFQEMKWMEQVESNYRKLLALGYRSYDRRIPRKARPPRAGPKQKKEPGFNLLLRLHFYQKETLGFLRNQRIPFTNNLAEQDLRMAKVKQKISGSFRSLGGAKAFFRLRSFLSTARKQGKNAYQALQEIFPPIEYGTGLVVRRV
jgi:transposase